VALDPQQALGAALRRALPRGPGPRRALVLGGGGALGSAVLEQLLASHRFEAVGVLAQARLQPALRGLQVVADEADALERFGADTALVVFDRQRHANGRDAAFLRPEPVALPAQAAALRAAGVLRLLVAQPHSAALLPAALKAGLASLDEAAVAALGFEQLVFMRMAQTGASTGPALRGPARLARWLLSQLHWMVPQAEQPVRSVTVARLATALAVALPQATPGTRVLAPEWLWHAAQGTPAADLAQAWLAGQLPPVAAAVRRRW
jgi:hypothetical protein